MLFRSVVSIALLVVCGLSLAACGGGDPAVAMQGKWAFDIKAAEKAIDADTETSDEEKKMAKGLLQLMAAFQMEISADKIVMGDNTVTYKVVKTEGNTVTIETTAEDGTKKTGQMVVNGDSLSMKDGDDDVTLFKRAKK